MTRGVTSACLGGPIYYAVLPVWGEVEAVPNADGSDSSNNNNGRP
jgi:hypothetical protein